MPLVSVIMCVRDGETYLREALDSIANQAIDDLQTIVVDDGSTDDSPEIARAHRLKPLVVTQERLGLGAALNHGLRLAEGRFVSFLDCDDIWPDGRLDTALAALADSDIDFVFGRVVNTDLQLNAIAPPLPARLPGSMVIRRAATLKIGEFRTDIVHGSFVDWCSRAQQLGLRSLVLDDIVLLRRIHGDNLGIRDRSGSRRDFLRVVRDHLDRKRQ